VFACPAYRLNGALVAGRARGVRRRRARGGQPEVRGRIRRPGRVLPTRRWPWAGPSGGGCAGQPGGPFSPRSGAQPSRQGVGGLARSTVGRPGASTWDGATG